MRAHGQSFRCGFCAQKVHKKGTDLFLATTIVEDLHFLADLSDTEEFRPLIDQRYPHEN